MADIEMYRQSWDSFLEAYSKVAQQNRTLIDLVCDMAEKLEEVINNQATEDDSVHELFKRYKEIMNLDG